MSEVTKCTCGAYSAAACICGEWSDRAPATAAGRGRRFKNKEAADAYIAHLKEPPAVVPVSHECYGDRHDGCAWPRCECGCHRGR